MSLEAPNHEDFIAQNEANESQSQQPQTREQLVDEAVQRCEANPDATGDYKDLMIEFA